MLAIRRRRSGDIVDSLFVLDLLESIAKARNSGRCCSSASRSDQHEDGNPHQWHREEEPCCCNRIGKTLATPGDYSCSRAKPFLFPHSFDRVFFFDPGVVIGEWEECGRSDPVRTPGLVHAIRCAMDRAHSGISLGIYRTAKTYDKLRIFQTRQQTHPNTIWRVYNNVAQHPRSCFHFHGPH